MLTPATAGFFAFMLIKITPAQALLLSLLAAILTIALKTAAWWLTGSVGFLSDALESLVNLAAAAFALTMVMYARQPPDAGHPYGHGKAEYFSAAFEGALILAAAIAILVAAGERLLNPRPIQALGLGTALSVAASVINLGAAWVLLQTGRRHRSIALEADARHLLTDVWTTAGVVVGVALAMVTGWLWLDPVVAMLVAANILREGWRMLSRAAAGLMDRSLSHDDVVRIEHLLEQHIPQGCHYVNLRTRRSGVDHFVDIELRVPGQWTVTDSHEVADHLEARLAAHGYLLNTHVEPIGIAPHDYRALAADTTHD